MINLNGKDLRQETIKEINDLGMPVFIYRNGIYGKILAGYLKDNGIISDISYVIDDDYFRNEDNTVSMSRYLSELATKSVLVLGVYDYDAIVQFIDQYAQNIPHIYYFSMTVLGTKRISWDKAPALKNLPYYNNTYDMLSDEASKQTLCLYLQSAVNGGFKELYDNCYSPVSYFNDITCGMIIDSLIDCGAFDGDSIHDFIKVFPDYKNIYAVEPDASNLERLAERISRESIDNVSVLPYGVYKNDGVLYFSNDGTSSSHINEGGAELKVISIDSLTSKHCAENERIMIKMDIEGSELDALMGAKETIIQYHPCLTICVYHKENDLFEIPAYIDSLVEKGTYEYKLGFHGKNLCELVFYAIPSDRHYHRG